LDDEPASLKARVGLAQQLAKCLLYLHATNWLHKALRSSSIVFFSEKEGPEINRPYISGFEYSRPDQNNATFTGAPENPEWAVYCHPDYLGRPGYFRKTYGIYSLGIILLEIAYWKRAEAIFGLDSGECELLLQSQGGQKCSILADNTGDPSFDSKQQTERAGEKKARKAKEIRDWLLVAGDAGGKPEYLETVRNIMGDRYHNAVRACIGGLDSFHLPKNVDQTDPVIATLLQQAYLRLVVDVLHEIVV
jgi:hypothetical protein